MLTTLLFAETPGVRVGTVQRVETTIHLEMRTTRRAARCPQCRQRSRRVHERYGRTLRDLAWCGTQVVLHLQVRRFVCARARCPRRTFTERLPTLVAPHARRTVRLTTHLERTGFALGGAPGARHLAADGLVVSRRTLLRLVRAAPLPPVGPVRVVGVDDWARRRGRTYGTILVNLETRRVLDLLPDRTAETLAAWLSQHPEIEVVSRDRGGAYADGARTGAPQAVQVADRFHLLANLTDAVERVLASKQRLLRQAAQALRDADHPASGAVCAAEEALLPPCALTVAPPRLTRTTAQQARAQADRVARPADIVALQQQGLSLSAIARQLGLTRPTVRTYLRAAHCPERASPPTLLAPYEGYLWERWTHGCQNARLLWQEIRAQGFRGSYAHLRHALTCWRTGPAARGRAAQTATPPPAVTRPAGRPVSVRQSVWLLLRLDDALNQEDRAFMAQLALLWPQVTALRTLAQEFGVLVRTRHAAGLEDWLCAAEQSAWPELASFATGLRRDRAAVDAGLTLEWSQGQVEGQVNRVKVLKRVGYGRCGFDLLKQRVLHVS